MQKDSTRSSFVSVARWPAVCTVALLAVLAWTSALPQAPAPTPVVAAASDLQFALEEIAEAFRADTGAGVRLTFGSSGNFARQIEQGAPFEVYFSADEEFVRRLDLAGLTRDEGTLYAVGRIVIFAPNNSSLAPDPELSGLRDLLARDTMTKFAIANPEHAPYGRAGMQALEAMGLWDDVQQHLLLGENIAQAAQFVVSGNAAGGILAYSLVLAPSLRDTGRFALLPESLHEPLRQRMVLLRSAGPAAERFYAYVRSASARAILRRYGFTVPGEQSE